MAIFSQKVRPSSSSVKPLAMSLCIFLFHNVSAAVTLSTNRTIPAVFAFGDSLLDTGNNNYLLTIGISNFPPYGRDFLGGKPTGRFSNGRLPSDLIAEGFGVKETLPPYLDPNLQLQDLLTGVCFDSAGSGYDPQTAKTLFVLSISNQLDLFKGYKSKIIAAVGKERTAILLSESLFILSTGSSDLFGYFSKPPQYDISVYTDFLLQSASNFVQELYALGVRVIVVTTIAPIGCVPLEKTINGGIGRNYYEPPNKAAILFNSKLSALINSLNKRLPEAQLIYLDSYNPLLSLLKEPAQYGFEVVDKGCCGTGTTELGPLCNKDTPGTCNDASKYIFWDSVHLTEKAYRILTSALLKQISSSEQSEKSWKYVVINIK